MNTTLTGLFTLECVMKIFSFGFRVRNYIAQAKKAPGNVSQSVISILMTMYVVQGLLYLTKVHRYFGATAGSLALATFNLAGKVTPVGTLVI